MHLCRADAFIALGSAGRTQLKDTTAAAAISCLWARPQVSDKKSRTVSTELAFISVGQIRRAGATVLMPALPCCYHPAHQRHSILKMQRKAFLPYLPHFYAARKGNSCALGFNLICTRHTTKIFHVKQLIAGY